MKKTGERTLFILNASIKGSKLKYPQIPDVSKRIGYIEDHELKVRKVYDWLIFSDKSEWIFEWDA